MPTLGILLSSLCLLVLMVWLRWTARTTPNADLLLDVMRDTLNSRSKSGDRTP